MKINRISLSPSLNLTHIQTGKFKSSLVSISFLSHLSSQHASEHALLPSVLLRGTIEHPNLQSMSQKMDELYGSIFSPQVYKVGEIQLCGLYLNFPDEAMLPAGSNILENILQFTCEILQRPYTENYLLREDFVVSESKKLTDKIKSIYNNKRAYAQYRCIQEMCEGEDFAIPAIGTISGAESLDNVSLTEEYNSLMQKAPVEIFYCGSKNVQEFKNLIDKLKIIPERKQTFTLKGTEIKFSPKTHTAQYYEEKSNIEQTNLVMGYRLGYYMKSPNLAAIQLFNILFGGAPSSKLFTRIREAESLCYFIDSSVNTSKGIMIVSAGIDLSNVHKVIDEVDKQLDTIRKGNISDSEFNTAKKTLVNDIGIINDSSASLSHFYTSNAVRDLFFTTSDYANKVYAVKKDEIIAVAESIRLDQIFVLKSGM